MTSKSPSDPSSAKAALLERVAACGGWQKARERLDVSLLNWQWFEPGSDEVCAGVFEFETDGKRRLRNPNFESRNVEPYARTWTPGREVTDAELDHAVRWRRFILLAEAAFDVAEATIST